MSNKQKNKLTIYIIIILLFTIIFYSSFVIYRWYLEGKRIAEINEYIVENNIVDKVLDSEDIILVNPPEDKNNDYWNYIKIPLINVNFDELLTKNKDTVGFINVLGTNINYPVVQDTDNEYYLKHAYDKTYNNAGWIFADYRNNMTTFDKNTIIYGHARKDGAMFGTLKNILTNGWLDDISNYIVRLSTPIENTLWQVFSVYHIETESEYIKTTFKNNLEYQNWLDKMKDRSKHDFNVTLNEKDKILTLSTCYDYKNTRVVLHAKLIKKEIKEN